MSNAPLTFQRARQEAAVAVIGDAADPELIRLVVFHPAPPPKGLPDGCAPNPAVPDTPGMVLAQEAVSAHWTGIDALAESMTEGGANMSYHHNRGTWPPPGRAVTMTHTDKSVGANGECNSVGKNVLKQAKAGLDTKDLLGSRDGSRDMLTTGGGSPKDTVNK